MAHGGERSLVCPDCGKRGVRYRHGSHQDGGYGCRYCDFWAYELGNYHEDQLNRDRLDAANPPQTYKGKNLTMPVIAHDKDGAPIAAGDMVTFVAWWPGVIPKGLVGTDGAAVRVTRTGRLVVKPWDTTYGERKPVSVDPSLIKLWSAHDA